MPRHPRTSGVKKGPQAKASPTPAGDWVPGGVWLFHASPSASLAPGVWVKKPCAVRFREQGTPEQVFSPTRGHTLGPSAAGSKIRHPDQGSALDAHWEQLQEAPLLRRQAAGGRRAPAAPSAVGGLQRQPLMFGTFQRKVLFDEYATCITGTWVVVGVDASFVGAPNGGPSFLAAGTCHVHGHFHGLL